MNEDMEKMFAKPQSLQMVLKSVKLELDSLNLPDDSLLKDYVETSINNALSILESVNPMGEVFKLLGDSDEVFKE